MFGVERETGNATGPRNRRDASAQGRHGVAFAGGGQIGADNLRCRRHRRQAILDAPRLEIRQIGGVGSQRRRRIGGVLVCLGFCKRHGGGRARRLGAVQAGELAHSALLSLLLAR